MIDKLQAIQAIVSGRVMHQNGNFMFLDGQEMPSESEIQAKLTELQNAEPMRILREERDRKLTETDWWCASDRTPTQAQLDYRQALRDLPSNSTPSLDEDENLTGVEWPNKPE